MTTGYMISLTTNGHALYVGGEDGTSLCDRDRADVYPTYNDATWAAQWASEDVKRLKRWYGRGDGRPVVKIEQLQFADATDEIVRLSKRTPAE